jgi:hypothetical protein
MSAGDRGILVFTGVAYATVTGNRVSGSVTANYVDNGTNTFDSTATAGDPLNEFT